MRPVTMQADQLKPFALFLEEHPGFSPLLMEESALAYGFQVGGCHLRIDEMERLIATQPQFDAQAGALLLAPSGAIRTREL